MRARRWRALLLAVAVVLGVVAGAPTASADVGDVGYEGPSHVGTGTPTGTKRAESVLWFNDGSWWANMWDTGTNDFYIFRWNAAATTWVKTPTRVDTRANTHSDVLWDGSKLYIASHLFVNDEQDAVPGFDANLYRYSYDTATDTYTLDAGYPGVINNMKTETLTIDKDSTGTLWATWMQGTQATGYRIHVNHSLPNDQRTWTSPIALPGAAAVSFDDTSSVIAYQGAIGVMWSSQHAAAGMAPDGVYFAIHKDGASDTAWSAPITAFQAPQGSDDHMNLKWLEVSGGQIYAAVKTSFTSGSQALLQLLVLDIATLKWRPPYTIAQQSECGNRVILLIDESKGLLRTFATYPGPDGVCSTSGGAIYEKSSPLNTISFPAGKGNPVINDNSDQVVHNATSTKQNIRAGMGVVVLADNNRTSRYWTFYEPSGGTQPGDTTPPDTTITSGPPSTTPDTTASFAFSATEAGSTFQCKLDAAAYAACTSPASYSGLAPGSHTFSVRATDAAGNTDQSPATVTWTVAAAADTTPPDTTITSGPPSTTPDTTASFAFSATEAGSTFQCKLDAAAYAACTSPASYSGLAPGSHTFSVRATDAAGNTDQSPATATWTVGTTPGGGITRASVNTVANSTATATVTVPLPAGTAAGDLLVSCLSLNGGAVRTAPAGWTQIAAVTAIANPHVYGYFKVAAAGEPTPSWQLSGSVVNGAGIARYTGAAGLDGVATQASGAAASSGTVPGLTTTSANAMVVGCMALNSGSTAITGPSGMSQAWEVAGKRSELDDAVQPTPGATGNRTWTFAAAREWAGWLVALRAR